MKEKLEHPKETICLLLYKQPLTIEEISTTLYNARNSRVSGYVKELAAKGWIKIKLGKMDHRKRVCYATSKGLFDSINQFLIELDAKNPDINVKINSNERKKLLKFFNDKPFKKYVQTFVNHIDYRTELDGFSYIKKCIGLHCMYLYYVNAYLKDAFGKDKVIPGFGEKILSFVYQEFKKLGGSKEENLINYSIAYVDFAQLGFNLLKKLGNLADLRPNLLGLYFDALIFSGEEIIRLQNGKGEKNKSPGLA